MKFAVLASPDSWYARDLVRAGGERHPITVLPFSQIESAITEKGITISSAGHDLAQFDALLVRTMPPGSLEQVVFRMDALARCEASGLKVVNSARSIEAAVDKYLASAKLRAAGLLTPRTITCQTVEDAMLAFEQLGGDVVIKPLFGSEGRGITRASDPDIALRAFKLLVQLGAVLYLQEFVPHEGHDVRLFVLGTRVFGMRRYNPHDWRTNVSRGASTERLTVSEDLAAVARKAAEAVGAQVAGIDLLPSRSGEQYVLEVNAVPGWRALARVNDIDMARLVLDFLAGEC